MSKPRSKPTSRGGIPPPTFALARIAVGVIGATAIASAAVFVVGPFCDLGDLQFAAGPQSIQPASSQPAAIVMALTGQIERADPIRHQALAASVPLAHLVRGSNNTVP